MRMNCSGGTGLLRAARAAQDGAEGASQATHLKWANSIRTVPR